ncbi:MAG: flavin reductase family protein [Fusicatenibacter sp.]
MKEINVKDLTKNPFSMIGDEWMLITARKGDQVNTMTASWGGVGIMWGKNIATCYIRPQRYTREFVDAGDTFTLSFFDGEQKKAMGYVGRVSGRDEPDKIEKAGLHLTEVDGQPTFEEASLILVCKKLYVQEMKEACFLGTEEIEKWYPQKDYHFMYMSEIVKAYEK